MLEGTLTALNDCIISEDGGVAEEFDTLVSPQPEVRSKHCLYFFYYSQF